MNYAKIATMAFQSKGGTNYTAEVYKRDAEAAATALTPAATPFETEENNSNDPLEPVRGSTGYMRFVYDGGLNGDGEPSFVDFVATDATQISVILRDADSSAIMWQGFVKPSQYSQSYNTQIREISVPLVSGLEVFDAIEMDATNVIQPATWRELLKEAINATGLQYDAVVVPYEWGTQLLGTQEVTSGLYDFNYTAPFITKASRWAWFDVTDAKNIDDPNYKEVEGKTYKEMLKDWCRYWGWSVHERGQVLYFVSRRTTIYCRLDWAYFESDAALTNLQPMNIIRTTAATLSDDMLDGTGHTYKAEPGVRTVEVDADTQEIDNDVLSIGDNDVTFELSRKLEAQRVGIGETTNIYRKELLYTLNGDKAIAYDEEVNEVENPSWVARKLARWASADWYERSEETADPPKINYNYAKALYVEWYASEPDVWATQTLVKIKSKKSFIFNGGYLCLNMSVKALLTINVNKDLRLVLSVGGNYWNGEAWQTDRCTFDLPMEYTDDTHLETETTNTKTLDMNCNAEGYMVEVSNIEGPLTLELIARPLALEPESGTVRYLDRWLITDFSVEYVKPEDEEGKELESVNKYYAVTGLTGTETETVSLNIATNNNNNPGHGLLKYGNVVAGALTFRTPTQPGTTTAEPARPEEKLLEVARQLYGVRRQELDMVVTMDNRERPVDRYRREEWNDQLWPVAENIDWAEDRRTLTLLS